MRSHRIPDCTFGLAVEHTPEQHKIPGSVTSLAGLLDSKCLKDLFWHHGFALVSDPKWLSLALVFPWAVYEAKKLASDAVLEQVKRASEIYLNILHDLALEPGPPEAPRCYQVKSSSQFQVFSMTSEGPNWKLYVCYRREIPEEPAWLQHSTETSLYVRL